MPLLRRDTNHHDLEEHIVNTTESNISYRPVIARVSAHLLRLEREYHLNKAFAQTSDPDCLHVTKLIDLVPLPSRSGDDEPLLCSIFESPGRNLLRDLLDFGPAGPGPTIAPYDGSLGVQENGLQRISIPTFLDFAIGACESLELLHHGLRVVHGELRADAFHFNEETRAVRLVNLGSGPRSFEHGLTSRGWLLLSQELGVKHKLQFIAPEQTGRMPAEPDSRTDIYSLGILFWTLLAGKAAFEGEHPIDVIQAVLGKRLPPVSSARLDVPDAVSNIICHMTQKQIEDRYHSISGLKHDLRETRRMLEEGDSDALAKFSIGTKDVSSFFMLPSKQYGREAEHIKMTNVIEKVANRQRASTDPTISGLHTLEHTSSSHISDRRGSVDLATRSSDTSSITGHSASLGPQTSDPIQRGVRSIDDTPQLPLSGQDHRASAITDLSSGSQRSGNRASQLTRSAKELSQPHLGRGSHASRRKYRCELVSIIGAAGIGKTSLISSARSEVRKHGYFASAKLDSANKAPFQPLLQTMSSLIRQIFSESDLDTEYHRAVMNGVRPFWPSVCSMLDLPESLLTDTKIPASQNPSKFVNTDISDNSSSHSGQSGNTLSVDLLRGSITNSRSVKFMEIFIEILRVLATHKLISLCFDNIQYADNESLELLSKIMEMKLGIVILVGLSAPFDALLTL